MKIIIYPLLLVQQLITKANSFNYVYSQEDRDRKLIIFKLSNIQSILSNSVMNFYKSYDIAIQEPSGLKDPIVGLMA